MVSYFIKAQSKLKALSTNNEPKQGDVMMSRFIVGWVYDDKELFLPNCKADTYYNNKMTFNDKITLLVSDSVKVFQDGYNEQDEYIRDWIYEKNTAPTKKISAPSNLVGLCVTCPVVGVKPKMRFAHHTPLRDFEFLDDADLIEAMNSQGFWETSQGSNLEL